MFGQDSIFPVDGIYNEEQRKQYAQNYVPKTPEQRSKESKQSAVILSWIIGLILIAIGCVAWFNEETNIGIILWCFAGSFIVFSVYLGCCHASK
jgi:hypothetical protein